VPLPHEGFDPVFTSRLKTILNRARAAEQSQEVWAVMHFDTDLRSVETFHSHGSTGAILYKQSYNALLTLEDHPSKADKARYGQIAKHVADVQMQGVPPGLAPYVAMHAEEELITAFPRVLADWTQDHPYPTHACIYLNWSPCNKSPAKAIGPGNQIYPLGCMHKIPFLANTYQHAQIIFTVYYDTIFENTPTYTTALTNARVANLVEYAPMPAALRD
jgi:hypothetical protein